MFLLRRVLIIASQEFEDGEDKQNTANELAFDTEMVQEQEQEQQQEQEVEEEQQVVVDHATSQGAPVPWTPQSLAKATTLVPSVFYPLNTFTPSKRSQTLPYPANVLLSENYAPFMHRSDLPRRLKNVTVVLEWKPADAEKVELQC